MLPNPLSGPCLCHVRATADSFVDKKPDIYEYCQASPDLRPDLRCKKELKGDDLCVIGEEVGDLQQRFGYALEKRLLRGAAGE